MKKCFAVFALVSCATVLTAVEPAEISQLGVAMNIHKSMATQRNIGEVMLINNGEKPITVFTQGMGQGFEIADKEKKKGKFSISLATTFTWQKHELVASKYNYLPVTLQPGEATVYKLLEKPSKTLFERLQELPNLESLTIEYNISDTQAKRYEVWAGEAKSVEYKVVNGEIQAE